MVRDVFLQSFSHKKQQLPPRTTFLPTLILLLPLQLTLYRAVFLCLKEQWRLISRNLTKNEEENKVRYEHFWTVKSADVERGVREFRNPHDLGFRANWCSFWRAGRANQKVRAVI